MTERKHHDLKSYPDHFQPALEGRKTFEIRRNDRNYQPGDTVTLHEYSYDNGDHYTGRTHSGIVDYIDTFAQQDGYVVFSLKWPGMVLIK